MISPSRDEQLLRDAVLARILAAIDAGETIKLPPFDPNFPAPSSFALENVGVEPNPFGGTVAGARYQFEAEEDLLHLFVMPLDGGPLSSELAREVAGFVLGDVPRAMIWYKAGANSHHFYIGHEALTWLSPTT